MTFHLTEEQTFIQKATRDFSRGEFDDDQILELIEKKQFPEKLLKKACKLDLIGLTFPEFAGGQECGMTENVLVAEELCRRDSTAGIALSTADMGAELIARYGDKKLVKSCIPPLLKGKTVTALICPELGEEKGPVDFAEKDDILVLKGEASLVPNADRAAFFMVVAHARDEGKAGKRILAVVSRETPGITIGEPVKKLGLDMTPWIRVSFDNVEIPARHMISTGSDEDPVLMLQRNVLLKTCGMFLGMAQGAFDLALGYAKQREQFRRKIAQFQGISQKIARMYIQLRQGRAMVYAAAQAYDRGRMDLHDLLAAKLTAETTAEFLTDEALQIHGGVGYMIEFPVEHFFRDVKCLRTFMGRKTTQMDLIGRKVVGRLN